MGQHAKHTASPPDTAQVTGMSSREGVEAYKRLPRLMSLLRNAQCRHAQHDLRLSLPVLPAAPSCHLCYDVHSHMRMEAAHHVGRSEGGLCHGGGSRDCAAAPA